MRPALAIILAALILPAGCAQPPPPVVHPLLVSHYTLDSGDELRIVVFGQADLSNTYAVDRAGYISMPLIGSVVARGRTTKQLEADIAARLARDYVRNPDVSVEVAQYRPFFIMGEVGAAGQYEYVTGLTIEAAIAVAGGFTPRADRWDGVLVQRQMNGEVVHLRLPVTDPVQPGDTITVRQRLF